MRWIAVDPQDAEKAVATLKDCGFNLAVLSAGLFLEEGQIVRLGVPPVRIGIATGISGVRFEQCYAARVVDELDGVPVNLIDLEHLKINKRAAGRHKDLDDLVNLP